MNKRDEQVETLNGNLNPWKVPSERSEAVCERRVMYLNENREDGLLSLTEENPYDVFLDPVRRPCLENASTTTPHAYTYPMQVYRTIRLT